MINLNDMELQIAKILVSPPRTPISYSDISYQLIPPIDPHSKSLADALGNVSCLCHELGLPLLSANAMYKNESKVGKGFIDLYSTIFPDCATKDPDEIWFDEMNRVTQCKDWKPLLDYIEQHKNQQSIGIIRPHALRKTLIHKEEPIPISQVYPDEIQCSEALTEGIKRSIIVNAYERNAEARKQCIDFYKSVCFICGFDFAKVYGSEFEGEIHVHHIKPLSEINREYIIDPIKDLRPVCPNCHMILHSKRDGVYTIDEVIEMIKRNKE